MRRAVSGEHNESILTARKTAESERQNLDPLRTAICVLRASITEKIKLSYCYAIFVNVVHSEKNNDGIESVNSLRIRFHLLVKFKELSLNVNNRGLTSPENC